MSTGRISPTAFYTGQVWVREGLSDVRLGTRRGAMLHALTVPILALGTLAGVAALDDVLVARHTLIDDVLEAAIARGEVGQIVEIAAGLSGRGVRLSRRHGVRYVEADLPHMIAKKRAMLDVAKLASPDLRLVSVDILADRGPLSVAEAIGAELDPGVGTAVVTEGLLSYFPLRDVEALWSRIHALLASLAGGVYVAEVYLSAEHDTVTASRLFRAMLGQFVRGKTHLHFATGEEATAALRERGFADVALHAPAGARRALVNVLEGHVPASQPRHRAA